MDITSSDDPPTMVSEGNRTVPASRKSLLDMLGGSADHPGHNPTITISRTQDPGVSEPTFTSPLSTSSSNPTLPRPESRLNSDFRGLSVAVDVPRAETSSWLSAAPGTYAHEPPDSDMIDLYTDPDSPSRSPLSLFSDLSEAVRESAELDRITTLHHQLGAEREELLTRHDETARALSRTKTQLDRVLSLTDEAIKITTVFVDKEKTRLDIKKTKVETRIERKKNLETERRKAKELERIRQHEEEQKAQVEMEQQAERQRLEEQRKKEETLAAERKRQEEIQARARAQAEERHRLEEEERQRLAEDQRRQEDEERKRRAEEEQQKEEEERLHRRLAEEREAIARKQEEDRRNQLLERRRLAEEERKQKEAGIAAAKAEAEKQAAEKEQQRIFQQRRATALKDKWKNYNRPESGVLPTGSPPSILEGASSSNLPSITVNDVPTNPHAVTEHYPGFVPATTEAGRLPSDLSQKVKVSDSLVNYAVKHETTSPVIVPVDNDQPMEDNPPTQLSSRSVSSMSTSAPTPLPAQLPAPPHLPPKPVAMHSKPPVPLQQSGRSRRYSTQRSRSRSPSPRRGSPSPRIPSRVSRSPDAARGRYKSPPAGRWKADHYSPPHPPYRGGGSRYERDSRSDSPPPPPPPPQNSRKRALQVSEDSWAKASTPSKLDYSHPQKRRAVSPFRSRSPPSPPPVVPSRRLPRSGGRGRGGGPPQSQSHLSLEQRLSRQLSERIQ